MNRNNLEFNEERGQNAILKLNEAVEMLLSLLAKTSVFGISAVPHLSFVSLGALLVFSDRGRRRVLHDIARAGPCAGRLHRPHVLPRQLHLGRHLHHRVLRVPPRLLAGLFIQ